MKKRFLPKLALLASAAALVAGGTSCSEITAASDAQKGAAIGAVAGGVAGGARSRNQHGQVRPLGVGVGAAAGAAGGYFIGKQVEQNKENQDRIQQLERERQMHQDSQSRY